MWIPSVGNHGSAGVYQNSGILHSSPKVMAVFLFLSFENFLIGGMFSILETIKTDTSTLILQNKNWCQMINPMFTTFQMWQNWILQNQVRFERLISLSKTPYIFVKISKPRNWDPYSIYAMSHGNRTSSYETVAHKLRPSVAFDWQYTPRQKLWPFPQTWKWTCWIYSIYMIFSQCNNDMFV